MSEESKERKKHEERRRGREKGGSPLSISGTRKGTLTGSGKREERERNLREKEESERKRGRGREEKRREREGGVTHSVCVPPFPLISGPDHHVMSFND